MADKGSTRKLEDDMGNGVPDDFLEEAKAEQCAFRSWLWFIRL